MRDNKSGAGFTLFEVIIVIGLIALLATIGLFLSFDFYKSYAYRSERSTIVSVLQKARSLSLNNINERRHGVHFLSGQYIIFECPSGTPQCNTYTASASDQQINAAYNVSITTPGLPFDVVFEQLSGSCMTSNCSTTPLTITVSDGTKSYNILVNSEGQIDW